MVVRSTSKQNSPLIESFSSADAHQISNYSWLNWICYRKEYPPVWQFQDDELPTTYSVSCSLRKNPENRICNLQWSILRGCVRVLIKGLIRKLAGNARGLIYSYLLHLHIHHSLVQDTEGAASNLPNFIISLLT